MADLPGEFSHESVFERYKAELKAYEGDVEFTGQTLVRNA